MQHDYGYVNRTKGADGEGIDVYLGPNEQADNAYVIHQNHPDTGAYDEDKVMLGFDSPDAAKDAYLQHYNRPGFYRSTTIVPMERFKGMLTNGDPGGAKWKVKQAREHATAAMFSAAYYLLSLQPKLSEADPGTFPKQVNDQPAKYFWGRGLKFNSTYVHPTKGWEMSATRSFIEGLEDNFDAMTANGVKVPIVDDHKETAAGARGYMVGYREKDGWFEPLLQFIGDDAIRMAARNEISLGIKPFTDGEGKEYGIAITHCGLTPSPVVPGQDGLRAASRGQEADGPDVFFLAATSEGEGTALSRQTPHPHSTMSTIQVSPEHVALMKRYCDMADGDASSPDMLFSRFVDKTSKLAGDHAALTEQHKKLDEEHKALVDQSAKNLSRAEAAERNLSRAVVAPTTDPEVLHERGLRIGERADRLVGAYTAADVAKIKAAVIGSADKPNTFMLSRQQGESDCLAAKLIDVLAEVKPAPKTGEQTGEQQIRLLSRPQDEGADKPAEAAKGNPMLDEANAMYSKKK